MTSCEFVHNVFCVQVCEGCYPRLVSGSRIYSCIYFWVVVAVFGAFVVAFIFFVSDFVYQRVTCFSNYVAYDFGALLVCFFHCERCVGLGYLVYYEVYM